MFKNYSDKKLIEKTKIYCGEQFDKSALVVETLGSIDELGAFLALAANKTKNDDTKQILKNIQSYMFVAGSDISSSTGTNPRIKQEDVTDLENTINRIDENLQPIKNFVIHSGSEASLLLNICRTLSRRTERRLIALKNEQELNDHLLKFFNRLSDLFFVLARYENKTEGNREDLWIG